MHVRRPLPHVFMASCSQGGRLAFTEDERGRMDARLKELAGLTVDVHITEHKETRSIEANRYYWGCVVKLCVDHTGDEPEDFHDEMCARFLVLRQIEIVDEETGEAREVLIPRRSSGLVIGDFYRFVEKVRKFAAEFLGVITPDPDPEYWRKREAASV